MQSGFGQHLLEPVIRSMASARTSSGISRSKALPRCRAETPDAAPRCHSAATGRALPVGDPMRPDRSAGSQQFLSHDVAFEHAALPAAVAPGPGHPDPATRPQPPAERRRPMTAEIAVWLLQPRSKLLGDKLASLGPRASDPGGGPTGSKRKAGYIVRCARGILKGYFIRGGLPTGRNIVLTTAT